MNQSDIFGPVFVMFILTLVVWVYMYARRIPFVLQNNLEPEELRPLELARLSPPSVSKPSDNLKNLFEIPVLFYVFAVYLFVTGQVDVLYVAAAWIFVVFRVLHSIIHCTVNIIMLRFGLYLVSTVFFWFMALRASVQHFA